MDELNNKNSELKTETEPHYSIFDEEPIDGEQPSGDEETTTNQPANNDEAAEVVTGIAEMRERKGIPSEAVYTVIGERGVLVSLSILFSYIRYYLNTGAQGDITIKIGHNKPPSMPFSFTVNEQLLDDIYPSNELEIN